jgi:hypothetical protein
MPFGQQQPVITRMFHQPFAGLAGKPRCTTARICVESLWRWRELRRG